MRKVKTGDRVIISNNYRDSRFRGKEATLKWPNDSLQFRLFFEFDEVVGAHDACGVGKVGSCFFGHTNRGEVVKCNCGKCLICHSAPAYKWKKL